MQLLTNALFQKTSFFKRVQQSVLHKTAEETLHRTVSFASLTLKDVFVESTSMYFVMQTEFFLKMCSDGYKHVTLARFSMQFHVVTEDGLCNLPI